jgi:hypothetical protein
VLRLVFRTNSDVSLKVLGALITIAGVAGVTALLSGIVSVLTLAVQLGPAGTQVFLERPLAYSE